MTLTLKAMVGFTAASLVVGPLIGRAICGRRWTRADALAYAQLAIAGLLCGAVLAWRLP
jgi:hypothetical protein